MDAQIQNIVALQQLSSSLFASQETIANDCLSIANLMDEKLADLLRMRDQAEELASGIRLQYKDALDSYADNVSKCDDLADMQNDLHVIERRSREADRILSDIEFAVDICRNAVTLIAEQTRALKNDTGRTIEEGRRFLSHASDSLRLYIEHSKKQ